MFKINYSIQILLFSVYYVKSTSLEKLLQRNSFSGGSAESDGDLADLILSKGYLPKVSELPKPGFENKDDNDANYLLSKLPDIELIKLLDEHPTKNEYDVKDLVQLALENGINNELNHEMTPANTQEKILTTGSDSQPYFRLENKPVQVDSKTESNYNALQKINSLLNSQVQDTEVDDDNREMLFDVLVAQLKTLCCKGHKAKKQAKTLVKQNYQSPYLPSVAINNANYKSEYKPQIVYRTVTTEHMFLILNEDIKSNGSDDLISVDPESLGKNSSVLLLGPLNRSLSDRQLKVVMNRISKELSKPEYKPILKQLSEGTLESPNLGLMKNLITGPETRRYIKPHRCNYQAKLSRVFGGTRWIICSGYLNLNTPSVYD